MENIEPLIITYYPSNASVALSNRTYAVVRNMVFLTEGLPNELIKINTIRIGATTLYESPPGTPVTTSNFTCNYELGFLNVDSSYSGQICTVPSYSTIGCIMYPAQRIQLQNALDLYNSAEMESFATEIWNRVDDLIAAIPSEATNPLEVVDARDGLLTESNANLKSRIDRIESNLGKITTKSSNSTLTASERGIIKVTTSSTDKTITLPTNNGSAIMRFLIIKIDSGAGKVIITGGSNNINGQTNYILESKYDYVSLITNGTSWAIESSSVLKCENNINIANVLYNEEIGLKNWRKNLQKVRLQTNSKADIVCIGDSLTEGSRVSETIGAITENTCATYCNKLRTMFATNGRFQDIGRGFIPANHGDGDYLTNGYKIWQFFKADTTGDDGTQWYISNYTYGVCGRARVTTTLDAYAEFTFNGTGIDLYFAKDSNGTSTPTEIYIKDGAGAYSLNTSIATYSATVVPYYKLAITGLTNAQHTVKIVHKENTKKTILLGAVEVRNTYGIRTNSLAVSAMQTNEHVKDYGLPFEISAFSPSLVVIAMGANEYNSQTAVATYKQNIQSVINEARYYGTANWKSKYISSVTYNINDLVTYNGVVYICIQSGSNKTPSSQPTYWSTSNIPTPVGADVLLLGLGLRNSDNEATYTIYQEEYTNALVELAQSNTCAFVNFNKYCGNDFHYLQDTLGYALDNYVHLNELGQRTLANLLYSVLYKMNYKV